MNYIKLSIKASVLISILSGCAIRREGIDNNPPFVAHKNVIERSFAQTGFVAGCLVGLPISIIALPVTIPMASNSKDAQGGLLVLAPIFGMGYGFGTLMGAVVWPFFGWYEMGPIKEIEEK